MADGVVYEDFGRLKLEAGYPMIFRIGSGVSSRKSTGYRIRRALLPAEFVNNPLREHRIRPPTKDCSVVAHRSTGGAMSGQPSVCRRTTFSWLKVRKEPGQSQLPSRLRADRTFAVRHESKSDAARRLAAVVSDVVVRVVGTARGDAAHVVGQHRAAATVPQYALLDSQLLPHKTVLGQSSRERPLDVKRPLFTMDSEGPGGGAS